MSDHTADDDLLRDGPGLRVAPYVSPVGARPEGPVTTLEPDPVVEGPRGIRLAGPNLVGSAVMLVASLGSGILTARLLGPQGRGLVSSATTLLLVVSTLGLLGLRDATIFVQARHRHPAGDILGTAVPLAVLLSVPVTAVAAGVGYGIFHGQGHHAQMVALLAAAFCPVIMVQQVATAMVAGRQHYRLLAVLLAGPAVAYTTTVVALRLAGVVSTGHVVAAFGCAYVPFLLLSLVALVRGGGVDRLRRPLAGELLRYGLRSQGGAMSSVATTGLDLTIMPLFVAVAAIGRYSVAVSVASMISVLFGALGSVVLSAAAARDSLDIVVRATRSVLAAASVAALGLAATAWFLIRLVYGSAYDESYVLMLLLLPGIVAWSANYSVIAGLQSIGRPGRASVAQAYGVAVTIVGLAVLLPTIGAAGASITSTLAYITALVFSARQLRLASGVHLWAGVFDRRALVSDVQRMIVSVRAERERR
ncbi:MAG: lipopolysaccharide biosynthesis protein [Mycobacteriales bacterium]